MLLAPDVKGLGLWHVLMNDAHQDEPGKCIGPLGFVALYDTLQGPHKLLRCFQMGSTLKILECLDKVTRMLVGSDNLCHLLKP